MAAHNDSAQARTVCPLTCHRLCSACSAAGSFQQGPQPPYPPPPPHTLFPPPLTPCQALDRIRSTGHVHAWAKVPLAAVEVNKSAKLQRWATIITPYSPSLTHSSLPASSMWEQHQREQQQLELQRAQVKAQLVQASGKLQLQRLWFL
jgi:hypothetical protein